MEAFEDLLDSVSVFSFCESSLRLASLVSDLVSGLTLSESLGIEALEDLLDSESVFSFCDSSLRLASRAFKSRSFPVFPKIIINHLLYGYISVVPFKAIKTVNNKMLNPSFFVMFSGLFNKARRKAGEPK
jgi:hypothetical protein